MSSLSETASSRSVRDDEYFLESIVFQVEDSIFKVPRHQFERCSEIFASIFTLPPPDQARVEGSDESCPLTLEGVSALDFRRFLKVLYPLDALPSVPNLNKDEWISVLKLATLWRFLDVRSLAITRLDHALQTDCISQILLGRQYDVVSWLRDGYGTLARREAPICAEEAREIGWDAALKIFQAREAMMTMVYGRPNVYLQRVDVEGVFAEELRVAQAAGTAYEPPPANVKKSKKKGKLNSNVA
ncbi:hypothetical protein C8F01DRAFT_259362 [Mycena amicta]|nr:hypothetical protein C8F01DRAFT_259362 [Mycena amicta]